MVRKILLVGGLGVVLLSSIAATAEKGSKGDPKAKSNTSSDNSSGNSLLGLVEGAIDTCNKISPGSMPGYRQVDQLFTNGQSDQAIDAVRHSDAYKDAYQKVAKLLEGLPNGDAVTACTSH